MQNGLGIIPPRPPRDDPIADDGVEEGLFGLVAFVRVDGGEPIGTGRRQGGDYRVMVRSGRVADRGASSYNSSPIGIRIEAAGVFPP